MAQKQIAWNSGSGYITLTYTGQGNGSIVVTSDDNNLGTARSQVITVKTTQGGLVTKNITVNQSACPFPVGTVKSYAYTGSYQEVELPAGSYKLQCWGAQGGSNAAASSYGITAKAGGKGGYSEGIITLSQKTKVRVYVGGQGSSSAGGYNGGGSTSGTSQYNASNTLGYSKMGGGGGATDIRLSDGALLSRMIVAGGGSGGAMCYKAVTTSTTESETEDSPESYGVHMGWRRDSQGVMRWVDTSNYFYCAIIDITAYRGWSYTLYTNSSNKSQSGFIKDYPSVGDEMVVYGWNTNSSSSSVSGTVPSDCSYMVVLLIWEPTDVTPDRIVFSHTVTDVTTSTESQVGYAGGGTNGVGYSSSYYGTQSAAGSGGSFGQGANQATTGYRYCSGAGGGGWYGGGGGQKSDSSMTYCKHSGGGSGWVNIASNAGNRPSGYTGLQLDSGTTYAGNTSFPSTSGGTETGHSGNGYAKITRLS